MVSSSLEVIGLLTHLFTPDGVVKAVIAAVPGQGETLGLRLPVHQDPPLTLLGVYAA